MEYTYNILDDVYHWMLSKNKSVEVRILKEKSQKIQIGDYITFYHIADSSKYIKTQVINKKLFNNIDDLLKYYPVSYIMPNHTEMELKKLLKEIYKNELEEKKLVAFEIKYL